MGNDTNGNKDQQDGAKIGRTWPDFLASFPMGLIAIVAAAFVAFLIYGTFFTEKPVDAGFLGPFGPKTPVVVQGGIPADAVVAFDQECQEDLGWVPFDQGAGKFILGAGSGRLVYQGQYHRPDNVPNVVDLKTVERGDQGGEEQHTLTEDEMPKHDHEKDSRLEGYWASVKGDSATNGFPNGSYKVTARSQVMRGESKPHNNMPPYIALYFCKKEAR
ncbi:MAG: hypothetical protein WD005_01575 [Haliea sp.]